MNRRRQRGEKRQKPKKEEKGGKGRVEKAENGRPERHGPVTPVGSGSGSGKVKDIR